MGKIYLLNCCLANRHIYESCDQYAKCDKKSKCVSSDNETTCQCYEEMDGHCIKCKY